jgi:predicted nucleic acid-binding protein
MTDIFVDTSGWASLTVPAQIHHKVAVSYRERIRQSRRLFFTTNYIIAELASLLTSPLRLSRVEIITIIDALKASPSVRIIHVDAELDKQAWQLFKQRQDKTWSLVDCSSFILMEQMKLKEALTTDQHFEQAGFVRLLKHR